MGAGGLGVACGETGRGGGGGGRVELEFNKVGTKNPWLGDTVTICLFVKIPIMSTFL